MFDASKGQGRGQGPACQAPAWESASNLREVDLDYDGKVDAVATYEGGRMAREDMFFTHRKDPDVIRLYGDGKLIEKRRDTDGNGTFDVFEFFDSGRIVRIGRDTNGDGQPDKYDESIDPEEVPPEERGGKPEPDKDAGG